MPEKLIIIQKWQNSCLAFWLQWVLVKAKLVPQFQPSRKSDAVQMPRIKQISQQWWLINRNAPPKVTSRAQVQTQAQLITPPHPEYIQLLREKKHVWCAFTWTIAGEVNPNISSPSKLAGGCRGGSLMVPSLCCLLISWLTLSRTISQHLVGDTLTNISLGQCSRYTWSYY